jgi:hypothetical protein
VQACRREHRDDEVAALKLQMIELGLNSQSSSTGINSSSSSGSTDSGSIVAHKIAATAAQLAGIRKQLRRIADGTAAAASTSNGTSSSSNNTASVIKAIKACHEVCETIFVTRVLCVGSACRLQVMTYKCTM